MTNRTKQDFTLEIRGIYSTFSHNCLVMWAVKFLVSQSYAWKVITIQFPWSVLQNSASVSRKKEQIMEEKETHISSMVERKQIGRLHARTFTSHYNMSSSRKVYRLCVPKRYSSVPSALGHHIQSIINSNSHTINTYCLAFEIVTFCSCCYWEALVKRPKKDLLISKVYSQPQLICPGASFSFIFNVFMIFACGHFREQLCLLCTYSWLSLSNQAVLTQQILFSQ